MVSNKNNIKKTILSILPILLIVGIVPIVSFGKAEVYTGNTLLNWNGNSSEIDFFGYYKNIVFLILTLISLIGFIFKDKSIDKNFEIKIPVYKLIIIYGLFIILSTVFSNYRDVALNGFVSRYEGGVTLIAYLIMFFISFNMFDNNNKIKILFGTIGVSCIIISLIGILQYFNLDIFGLEWIQKIIIPKHYHSLIGNLNLQSGRNELVYSTLGNANYIGSYISIVLPIMITLSIMSKKVLYKVMFSVVALVNFALLIASDSRGGMVGILITIPIFILLLRAKIFRNKKITIAILIGIFIVTVPIVGKTNNGIVNKFKDILQSITNSEVDKKKYKLQDLIVEKNKIKFILQDDSFSIEMNDENISFKDKNDILLEMSFDSETGEGKILNNSDYKNVSFMIGKLREDSELTILKVKIDDDIKINFTADENGNFKYVTDGGKIIDTSEEVKHWGFNGMERMGSGRGYIWSRTIPLVAEKPLLGFGPDCYAIAFPQQDYVGKYQTFDTTNMLIDKPHNMYLQIAVNTGIISLVAFLSIMGLYLWNSFKLYLNNKFENFNSIIGLAIFMAVIAYLITCIFNDSVVAVAPIFWIILGVGFRINYNISNNIDNEDLSKGEFEIDIESLNNLK